jgi:hypothetical protein
MTWLAALALLGGVMPNEIFHLSTEDTTIAVTGADGGPAVIELRRTGGRNWVEQAAETPLVDTAYVGEERRKVSWHYVRGEAAGGTVRLRFACREPKMTAVSVWEAREGPGPIEHHIEITNGGASDLLLPLQPSLVVALTPRSGHRIENWWVEKGAGRPSDHGTHREPVGPGYSFSHGSTPRSEDGENRDMIPWLSLQDATGGEGAYFGIEFSGRVAMGVASGNGLRVTLGLDPSGWEYRTRIGPGETFETPTVFVGCYAGDVDDGANRLHRFVERHLRPAPPDDRYPWVVNNTWGCGIDVHEKLARGMIDDSAALGCEMYHIDAGWFRGVGDWESHPNKFPNGLAPIADYPHSKGILFGLWVGWTQAGDTTHGMETASVDNPAQRHWLPVDPPPGWNPRPFTGATLCLASKPAREWCLGLLRRVVKEYKVDMLEHDQRMIVSGCARTDHGHTLHPADVAYYATRGYYHVYDTLRAECPKLAFEDCVDGGRMVDYGAARRVHYFSVTDSYDPLSNRRAFHDTSYAMPPSMCECYVENAPAPTVGTFRAMLRSGMMGFLTLMCDTRQWSAEQHDAARRQIAIYKEWIRPLVRQAELYHVSERPDGVRWDGMQYFDPQIGKGVLFAFRGTTEEEAHRFRLRGLRADARYRVWFEDGSSPERTLSGKELMSSGVEVNLPEPGTSELVYLQET